MVLSANIELGKMFDEARHGIHGDLIPGGVTSRKNDFVSVTDGACVA